METVRHNLRYFANLNNDSSPLNITIENNKIVQNEHSWLRSSSVEASELFAVIQWTFDNSVINFWENYHTANWLSERYKGKYNLTYDAFVSLQYIYDKCETLINNKLKKDMKDYDKELDLRLDLIYENCIETCKPWEFFKVGVRELIKATNKHDEYVCLDIEESDEGEGEESEEESEEEPLLTSVETKKEE